MEFNHSERGNALYPQQQNSQSDEAKTDSNEYYRMTNADSASSQVKPKEVPDLTIIQENLLEQSLVNQKSGRGSIQPAMSDAPHSDQASVRVKKPLLFIEVDTGESTRAKIEVFKGDDPAALAADFCEQHEYDENT